MMSDVRVVHGDCLAVLRSLPDASVDAVVTDPPYGLADHRPAELVTALTAWVNGDRERVPDGKGFMGKAWDSFVPPPAVWDECMRVLKPGGHMVVFAGSRTYDLMGLSIRLAGFEVRDGLAWLHGQGFPKGKAQLKPAHEPIVLARKPLSGTVAATVLEHGTGALNVDGCRVASTDALVRPAILRTDNEVLGKGLGVSVQVEPTGRWPANVVLSHGPECNGQCAPGCPVAELDAQTSNLHSAGPAQAKGAGFTGHTSMFGFGQITAEQVRHGDTGGASRFFPTFRYQAKAPKAERPKVDGVAHPTVKPLALMAWLVRLIAPPGGVVLDPFAGSGTTLQAARNEGMASIGIERDPSYLPLIAARLGLDMDVIEQMDDDDQGDGDGRVAERDQRGEPGLPLHGHGDRLGDEAPDPVGGDPAGREAVRGPGVPERVAPAGEAVSGPDFAALGTGMDIRQALDVLQQIAEFVGEDGDGPSPADAVAAVRAGVEELETRLNTARRTAWVVVPVEAETVGEGDLIEQKDGTLVRVLDAEHFSAEQNPVRLTVEFGPTRKTFAMPKDHSVPVLRRPTADALDILSRQLGAQVTT